MLKFSYSLSAILRSLHLLQITARIIFLLTNHQLGYIERFLIHYCLCNLKFFNSLSLNPLLDINILACEINLQQRNYHSCGYFTPEIFTESQPLLSEISVESVYLPPCWCLHVIAMKIKTQPRIRQMKMSNRSSKSLYFFQRIVTLRNRFSWGCFLDHNILNHFKSRVSHYLS